MTDRITPTQTARFALRVAQKCGLTVRLDTLGRLLVQPKALLHELPGVAAVLANHKTAVKAVLREDW